ncbi:MAG: cytochrome c oxidase subunit II [Planctomycetes bacterium]|nr:cytochrome c oxidase subunit II [Planctomycetota bacterium]
MAPSVDALYFFLLGTSALIGLALAVLVITFSVKYRRRAGAAHLPAAPTTRWLEIGWIAVMFVLFMAMFVWGARVYYDLQRAPPNALEIQVVGKQWMWKIQHPTGQREVNELHVPVGRPVKLLLSSEDVIHSFFLPAFRVKQDAVPGRTTALWFEATRPGQYHLFCAEYCGTGHSRMTGWIVVLEPRHFQRWLDTRLSGESPVAQGLKLFQSLGCATCHNPQPSARCPNLVGLFGRTVRLRDGSTVTVDDAYLRESILDPAAKIVEGYEPIMPTFQSRVSEEQLLQLLAYLKSQS